MSTTLKQRWNDVVYTTSEVQCCFNVETTYADVVNSVQRWFNVVSTLSACWVSTWGYDRHQDILRQHANAMTQKANNTVAFLRRNLSSCPRQIRAICIKSLVRPQLEYASNVWDHTNKTHINAVEVVQRRAARFITGDYRQESSLTAMLRNLQLESLQERRLRATAVMMFRVVSNLIDLSSCPLHPGGTATRGHTQWVVQPFWYHVKSYQDSFHPAGTVIWNSLPQDVINADSLESFKTRISAQRFY